MINKSESMILCLVFFVLLTCPVIVHGESIPQGRHEIGYSSEPPEFPVQGDVFDKRTMTLKKLNRYNDLLLDYMKEAKGVNLGRGFAEEILVTVAVENRCRHCYKAHILFAQNHEVTRGKIDCLTDFPQECFEPEEYAALRYARAWAEGEGAVKDAAVIENVKKYYSEKEIAWINEMIVLMCLANRTANTADAFLSRLKGKPRPKDDGGIGSELVMSTLFVVVATPVYIQTQIIKAKLEKEH
jgi:alkylhydroperoxidase family enzyme